MTKFKGYLDRLRENLETLDEQIENARKMSKIKPKGKDKAIALQYAKTLRDLIALRNEALQHIKSHLLGRDETGAVNEPSNYDRYGDANLVEFERDFKRFMEPWTTDDLKLDCSDCGKESEEVTERQIKNGISYDWAYLCDECYEKRKTQEAT